MSDVYSSVSMLSHRDATWPSGTLARALANSPKLARDDTESNGVTASFNPFRGGDVSE